MDVVFLDALQAITYPSCMRSPLPRCQRMLFASSPSFYSVAKEGGGEGRVGSSFLPTAHELATCVAKPPLLIFSLNAWLMQYKSNPRLVVHSIAPIFSSLPSSLSSSTSPTSQQQRDPIDLAQAVCEVLTVHLSHLRLFNGFTSPKSNDNDNAATSHQQQQQQQQQEVVAATARRSACSGGSSGCRLDETLSHLAWKKGITSVTAMDRGASSFYALQPQKQQQQQQSSSSAKTITTTTTAAHGSEGPSLAAAATAAAFDDPFISTGCANLDRALCGGFAKRAVTEVCGVAGAGKTQVALQCLMAAVCNQLIRCVFGAVERCINAKLLRQRQQQQKHRNTHCNNNSSNDAGGGAAKKTRQKRGRKGGPSQRDKDDSSPADVSAAENGDAAAAAITFDELKQIFYSNCNPQPQPQQQQSRQEFAVVYLVAEDIPHTRMMDLAQDVCRSSAITAIELVAHLVRSFTTTPTATAASSSSSLLLASVDAVLARTSFYLDEDTLKRFVDNVFTPQGVLSRILIRKVGSMDDLATSFDTLCGLSITSASACAASQEEASHSLKSSFFYYPLVVVDSITEAIADHEDIHRELNFNRDAPTPNNGKQNDSAFSKSRTTAVVDKFAVGSLLKKAADALNAAVVVTNQMRANFAGAAAGAGVDYTSGSSAALPALGMVWSYCVNTRLLLTRVAAYVPAFNADNAVSSSSHRPHNNGNGNGAASSLTTTVTVYGGSDRLPQYYTGPQQKSASSPTTAAASAATSSAGPKRHLRTVFSHHLPCNICIEYVIAEGGVVGDRTSCDNIELTQL